MRKEKAVGLLVGLATVAFAFSAQGQADKVDFKKAIPKEYRVGGWALGCQAYSFKEYTFFEAVDKTRETGCRLIEAYPGQKLSKENPVPFNHDAPQEVLDAARKKLDEAGVKLVAYGVVGLGRNEAANRKVFEFARKMGILTITSEPEEGSFELIDKLANEYGIPVAIHNHPRRADNPNYRYWSPEYVLECSKDRSKMIGACADTGHWTRSELKPVEALRTLAGHIVSLHLKDLTKFGRDAHDVPFGQGVSDVAGALEELRRQRFDGVISLEYEFNWTTSVPEIKQCVDFLRDNPRRVPKKK